MNEIQLVITLDQATGSVTVNGPIDNKLLCYGLLEAARDAIADHSRARMRQQNGGLVPVHIKLPDRNGA